MQVCLAEDDSASILQSPHSRGVGQGFVGGQGQTSSCSVHAHGIKVILEKHRNAKEGARHIASRDPVVQVVGNRESVGIQRDDGVDGRIEGFYSRNEG